MTNREPDPECSCGPMTMLYGIVLIPEIHFTKKLCIHISWKIYNNTQMLEVALNQGNISTEIK